MHLIEFGSLIFWLLVCGIITWDIWLLENDSGIGVTVGSVVGGFSLWFISGAVNPFPWLMDHWALILMVAITYVVMGIVWGGIKWWFFLHNEADHYETLRVGYQAEYDRRKNDTGMAGTTYKEWLERNYNFPPSPGRHKGDIIMWMVWWPISSVWTLLNDPLKRLYRVIYQHLVSTYTRMAQAVFAGRFTELK